MPDPKKASDALSSIDPFAKATVGLVEGVNDATAPAFDEAGVGSLAPGSATSVLDPLDFAGTKAGADAKKAAQEAADLQEAAGRDSVANLRQAQIEAAARQQPFETFGVEQGVNALPGAFGQLQSAISDPTAGVINNPFFQALSADQDQRLLASQAARGKVGSGGTNDELIRQQLLLGNQFSQQNIGNIQAQIQNQFNAAAIGQNAASQTGVQGLNTAGNIGGILGNVANSQAAAVIAKQQANQAITGNLQSIFGMVAAPFTGGASLSLTQGVGGGGGLTQGGGGFMGGGSAPPPNPLQGFGQQTA